MKIEVTKEDFENCGQFLDTENCLLATALKRQLPDFKISVGGTYFTIREETFVTLFGRKLWSKGVSWARYNMPGGLSDRIHDFYQRSKAVPFSFEIPIEVSK